MGIHSRSFGSITFGANLFRCPIFGQRVEQKTAGACGNLGLGWFWACVGWFEAGLGWLWACFDLVLKRFGFGFEPAV